MGVKQRPHIPLIKFKPFVSGREQSRGVRVRYHNAFRLTRRAGRVNHVGGLFRRRSCFKVIKGFLEDRLPVCVQTDRNSSANGKPVAQSFLG